MVMGAGAALYFTPLSHRATADVSEHGAQQVSSISLPLFFEPNQGQTDARVKFLARGSGYGIFLTADEAVLELQPSALSSRQSAVGTRRLEPAVVRMRLDGSNPAARVSGADRLPGKSNYFIGNDRSKWRSGIPQFARVEYKSAYAGIDLVYYGHQGQLEYDFRIAPQADPNQIALSFDGATARIDSGDLVLSTGGGEVRFHAPRIYQQDGSTQKVIAGSFRQIAENKIAFAVGAYDRARELVIDPVLSYSTYLGGSNAESSVHIAIGPDNNIYLAGSTMSSDFPIPASTPPSYQSTLAGPQNVFIAEINPNLSASAAQQLVYATYLGGSGVDTAAGVAVSIHVDATTANYDVLVAGSTTSSDFPTASVLTPFQAGPQTGTHGFVTRLNPTGAAGQVLRYSTYLAGNGVDTVTGLAIDGKGDAFVTGATTSTNSASGFPSTINAFQPCPWQPGVTCNVVSGPTQFFASKINTAGTGTQSMLYSTFFGGGYPASATVTGGGIAVDTSGNMYFTGGTNMPAVTGPNGEFPFPLFNAQQSCLDEPSKTVSCTSPSPSATDAFVAKINPNIPGQAPIFSTFLGGSGDDIGYGVGVDGSSNIYVIGSTNSSDWLFPTAITPIQSSYGGGPVDAFLAKIANPGSGGSVFPLIYFTYLGGSGTDIAQAIVVDANQGAHVTGYTDSTTGLPVTNAVQGPPPQNYLGSTNAGSTDAFVALISTTLGSSTTSPTGNYVTYLGGGGADQGTGIALDVNNATYVSGSTASTNFPTVNAPYPSLNGSAPDAFVAKLGSNSVLKLTAASNSPSPNPVSAGTPVAFTFDIANTGPDPAMNVIFIANVPATGVTTQTAKVTSGSGSCGTVVANTITCTISSLAVQTSSTTGFGVVEVDVTPTLPVVSPQITVSGSVSANGGPVQSSVTQSAAGITDFSISASPAAATTAAGTSPGPAFTVTLTPQPTYTASVSMTDSGLPAASTATFNPVSPISMSGNSQATTTLNISTTARPVTTGSLLRGRALYATWLPVGGLSLLGLGVGASRKRRRWLAGMLLGLIAGIVLLQPGCGSSSPATVTGGTPAGTYTITITGTSGSVSHSTTVLLTVT